MKSVSITLLCLCAIAHLVLCDGTHSANETASLRISKQEKKFWSDGEGIWSRVLEDYATSKTNRMARFVQPPAQYMPPPPPSPSNQYMNSQPPNQYMGSSTPNQYMSSPPGFYITKRVGEAMELEPHMRPPGKVIGPPNTPNFPTRQNFIQNQPLREVTETDLYLLGAIEKLVYRVDYLESRVRRSEQLIYYLMAGNKQQKEGPDPCPTNFSRVGDNCYHIDGDRQVNWKAANGICKSLGAHLAEFENLSENEDMVAYLLNHPAHRGKDFWLGGLNPGLLWIWSNSAKPVNPNTNLTLFASSGIDNSSTSVDKTENDKDNKGTEKIVNNSNEIKGSGRCLRLSYNPAKHTYIYFGQECTSRHHFLCEFQDRTLDNKIKKIARELDLDWL